MKVEVQSPYNRICISHNREGHRAFVRLRLVCLDTDDYKYLRFERIVEQMKQAQGITEQLKAENQMEWVARMNNI